ncbi:predicted protein [Naegleria gruberi]|uniref:Predicted protein n=1 Tax=Naegleria gruberi TaxID=5762 RepID=D2VHC5_NAEGR|nr:uncharacterized protein NAEGRDRAFT_68168 [Naegleria gruberi]EFC43777.1 predicted protein [Naegleria gruberi]|eukprot:XP_002676521.1 predicted protein [Naegleria gruberi strain NEG-M]
MRNILNHHTFEENTVPRPHDQTKKALDPFLREAMEALSINLQTFMKYTDFHESKEGRSLIFGVSAPTISFSCSTNNSVSMSTSMMRQSIIGTSLLQFDPDCVEEEEIILTESEYKQLEEIYFNPLKYLAETLKILNENKPTQIEEDKYGLEELHYDDELDQDSSIITIQKETPEQAPPPAKPLIIRGRAKRKFY